MRLGILVPLSDEIDEEFKKATEIGVTTCQVHCWDVHLLTNDNLALKVKESSAQHGIEITGFWCGWSGPKVWDFIAGPHTLGLVPIAYRHHRLKELMEGVHFAKKSGISNLITHVGFIPENPNDTEYTSLITVLSYLADYCGANCLRFLFETGQETPTTLARTIEDIGRDNVGVNLDPANLVMYGKANPVDALDILGRYVVAVHAKDGLYPVNGKTLGREVPLGEGKVNIPSFISKLKALGYMGPLTIEREISGEEQIRDIIHAKQMLDKL